VALGHYRYERPWSAYPLVDALARMAFDWSRGRHPELLSGAFYRPLDTAVPQQFFATSMLASSVAYGLLGWEPDAPGGRARLAPQLPPHWDGARVEGLRVGPVRLDAAIERRPGLLRLRVRAEGGSLALAVRPVLPPGARGLVLLVDGRRVSGGEAGEALVALSGKPRVVEARWAGGLEVEPPLVALEPGQADGGVRVLSVDAVPGGWALVLEGRSGSEATLRLHGETPASASPGTLVAERASTALRVRFPEAVAAFSRLAVRLGQGLRTDR
jgi:hypothetical protein